MAYPYYTCYILLENWQHEEMRRLDETAVLTKELSVYKTVARWTIASNKNHTDYTTSSRKLLTIISTG